MEFNNIAPVEIKNANFLIDTSIEASTVKKIANKLPIPPPMEQIDSTILGHVVGDFTLGKTGLEGHFLEETTRYMDTILREISNETLTAIPGLEKAIEGVDSYWRYAEERKKIASDVSNLKILASDIAQRVRELPPGERLFIPGGWSGVTTGHAIVHAIEPDITGESYKFYTFNSGCGINFHYRHRDSEGITRYKSIDMREAIPPEKMCDPLFFQALLELYIFPLNINDEKRGQNFLYTSILPTLAAKSTSPSAWTKNFQKDQRAGTCAWKCLMVHLRECCPKDYKKIKILMKYKTLQKYMKEHPIEQENKTNLILIGNAAEKLIRSFNKPDHQISEEEQRKMIEVLKALKFSAQRVREKNEKKLLVSEQWDSNKLYAPNSLFLSPESFPCKPLQPIAPVKKNTTEENTAVCNIALEAAALTPENVLAEVTKWGEFCEKLYRQKQYTSARFYVNQLLSSLPSPENSNIESFWNKVSDKERENLICKISLLNDILYKSAFQLRSSSGEDLFSILNSFAVQIRLFEPIAGYSDPYDNSDLMAIGVNGHRRYEYPFLGLQEKYNIFSQNDLLRKRFEILSQKFRSSVTIQELLKERFRDWNGPQCFDEIFLDKFQQHIDKKAKALSVESDTDGFTSALLSDFGQYDLLPPYLAAINKQAFLLSLFQQAGFLSVFAKRSFTTNSDATGEPFEILFPEIQQLLKSGDGYIHNANINHVGCLSHMSLSDMALNWQNENFQSPAMRYLVKLKQDFNQDRGNIISDPVYLEAPELQSIPYEERRKLLLLTQTPPETVIWQVINYFSHYWDRLEEPEFQALLDLLITNHLEDEIRRTPGNLAILLTFIERGVEQFSSPEKLNGFLFCLHFAAQIYSKLQKTPIKESVEGKQFFAAFSSWVEQLRCRLTSTEYSVEDKQACHVELAHLLLLQEGSKEQRAALLLAGACQQAMPLPRFLQKDVIQRNFLDFLQKHNKELISDLKDPIFMKSTANAISLTLFGVECDRWHISYPLLLSDDGKVEINLLTAEAKCSNLSRVPLPQKLLNTPEYKQLFGQRNFPAQLEGFHRFNFIDDKGRKFCIDLSQNDIPTIEMNIAGAWYRFLPRNEVIGRLSPVFCEDMSHWVRMEGEPEFVILNPDKEVRYRGKIDLKKSGIFAPHITQLSPVDRDNWVLSALEEHSAISRFENSSYILAWHDVGDKKCKKMEFPRFSLHFTPSQKTPIVMECEEFPGFHLCKEQRMESLPFLRHFLLIENNKGEKKALIPRYKMCYDKKKSSPLNPVGYSALILPLSYMIIDIDAKGLPKKLRGESALFFAYLAICEGDRAVAAKYIKIFTSSDTNADLVPLLHELLSWNTHCTTPHTVAQSLKIILQIYEKELFNRPDRTTYSNLFTSSCKEVEALFGRYLRNRDNTTTDRLSDAEEKRLLQILLAYTPLNERNFNRLVRLQSGDKLAEEVFAPPSNLTVTKKEWIKEHLAIARNNLLQWCRDSTLLKISEKGGGYRHYIDGLLTRPDSNIVPYFLEVLRDIDSYKKEPKQSQLQDTLYRISSATGAVGLLHDCLQAVLSDPTHFDKEIAEIKAAFHQKQTSRIERAIDLLIKNSQPAPVKEKKINVLSHPQLSRALPKPIENKAVRLKKEKKLPLLSESNLSLEDFLEAAPANLSGRIPVIPDVKDSPAANRQIAIMNRQLDLFYEKINQGNAPVTYVLKKSMEDLKNILTIQMVRDKEFICTKKATILAIANAPISAERAFYEEKRAAGGEILPYSLNELITFFYKGDKDALLAHCPNLTEESADKLCQEILLYLQHFTKWQQLQRTIALLDEVAPLERYLESGEKKDGIYYPATREDVVLLIASIKDQAAKELVASPAYDMDQHPEYLVMEYFADIRLRSQQVETLSLLLENSEGRMKELIVQLTMGSGKTKVLLPLLAMKLADGVKLPIVLVPPSLLETNKRDLMESSLKIFGQAPILFDFHRNSSLDLDELRFQLQNLQNCIIDKRYLLSTPTALKSLKLKYIELLFAEKNNPDSVAGRREQILLIGEMIKLLRERGHAIIDEADSLLDARRSEVNFPIDRPHAVGSERVILCEILMKLFLKESIKKEFVDLAENKQKDMIEDQLISFSEQFVGVVMKKCCSPEDGLDAALLKKYMLGSGEIVPDLKEHPKGKLFAQARELVTNLLPLVLRKDGNKDFGRSHISHKRYAIPYVASNTPDERSEFGNIDEVLLYSSFIYLQEGLKPYDISNLIEGMRRKVRFEAKEKHKPFKDTAAFKTCSTILGIANIFDISAAEREGISKRIQQNPKALVFWLKNFVYPDIRSNNQKLSANSEDLFGMLAHVSGFTGTPWNRATYPDRVACRGLLADKVDRPEDDIAVLDAIWRKVEGPSRSEAEGSPGAGAAGAIHILNENTPLECLETILQYEGVSCLLDAGALLKGIPNIEVAKKIQNSLQNNPNIKGTLYFDESNRITFHIEGCNPILLEDSAMQKIAIHERFSYYDQYHTIGTDIKQAPRAKALLTFKNNSVKDLTQAAMRMRKLLTTQTLEIVLPASTAKKMFSDTSPLFVKLLQSAVCNQSKRLEDDMAYATQGKLSAIAQQKLFSLLLTLPIDEKIQVIGKFEQIISDISSDDPPVDPLKKKETTYVVDRSRQYQIEEIEKLFEDINGLSEEVKSKLLPLRKEIIESLKAFALPDATLLPKEQYENFNATQRGTRVEVEKEVEVNEEIQKLNMATAVYNRWLYNSSPVFNPQFLQANSGLKYAPEIISLEEIFENNDELKPFKNIFSHNLQTTKNFVMTVSEQKQLAFLPDAQKLCSQLVIIRDEQQQLRAIMVDPLEAGWLRKALDPAEQARMIEEQQRFGKKTTIHPYLYNVKIIDLENGFSDTIGMPYPLEQEEEAVSLVAQAKFYNGYIIYSDEEWKAIISWMQGKERSQMKALFEKSLFSQPGAYKFYEKSKIQEFLSTVR